MRVICLLSLLGFALSLYLSLTTYGCPADDCLTIHRTAYGRLFDMPVAWLGLFGYALIGLTAWKRREPALKILILLGLIIESRLVYAQVVVLQNICVWCMISAGLMVSLFVMVFVEIRNEAT